MAKFQTFHESQVLPKKLLLSRRKYNCSLHLVFVFLAFVFRLQLDTFYISIITISINLNNNIDPGAPLEFEKTNYYLDLLETIFTLGVWYLLMS